MKLSSKFLTINGKRVGITISAGPWVAGVPADLIKVRPKKHSFPAEFHKALSVENNSDGMTDYFERGDLLTLTGRAEIVWEGPALAALGNAERAWRFQLDEGWWLRDALPWISRR